MSTVDEVRGLTGAGAAVDESSWVPVCRLDDLLPERGAAALVGGEQVALFRLVDDQVHAVGNLDPFSGAQVLARGIVGTRGGDPVVAGPLYKQHFDLRSGACLEEPSTRVPVHGVRIEAGVVHVALAVRSTGTVPDEVGAPGGG